MVALRQSEATKMSIKLLKPIHDAIKEGNLLQVKKLLDDHSGAIDLDTPFSSWLHVAAGKGQLAIVQELVKRGMDVNARGGILGGNALHAVADGHHVEVVKYLLDVGSEMDVSDSQRNPLFAAILDDNVDIAQLLINRGLDPMTDYGDDWNAIAFAKERGAEKCLKLLENVKTK
jgi:uncharacterized protein